MASSCPRALQPTIAVRPVGTHAESQRSANASSLGKPPPVGLRSALAGERRATVALGKLNPAPVPCRHGHPRVHVPDRARFDSFATAPCRAAAPA